jgi:preprotein translocase subunit SecD
MAINETLVLEWQVADAALKVAKERFDKVTNELAQEMLVQEIKSDLVCVRGDDYKVTVVQGETMRIDDEGLRKAMGAVKFRKIVKSKVDRKLLEKAIKDGVLDISNVSAFVSIAPNKPFVKVTPAGDTDDN